ncbi:helix-turn-helix domain-containing protein [Nocardia sp. NBC_01388]|uniref:helix-turn-helix domain-containing protein n=1 Tax=Nocardia sp. NBC_01388 TaxID=2903596 RepID=UPI0032528337
MDLDIGDVVARSGVPASTLRYYEERKLIASTGRRGQRRLFAPAVLDQLALIGLGRAAGFSLDDIAGMFAPDGRPEIDRAMLTTRADELDHTIAQLTAMSESLRHAAACPAPSHMECPTFRAMLAGILTAGRPGSPKKVPSRPL